jgi:hypothetical protein
MKFVPPTYCIELKNVDDYTDIKRFCRRHDIRIMVYTIMWQDQVLKFGIQFEWSTRTYGDRVYTQIGWMPGWEKPCLQRQPSTGQAVQMMIDKIQKTYNTVFHKNQVSVIIEDYTDYEFKNPFNKYAEMQNFEELKKLEFFKAHGYYPIGNLKQEGLRPIVQLTPALWEF